MSYTPPSATLSPSWEGGEGYSRPVAWLIGSWAQGVIYPAPFEATKWGEPFVTKQQFLDPWGWGSSVFPTLSLQVTLDWQYPPPFAEVNASWVGKAAYTTPSGSDLQAQWVMGSGPAEDQFADPTGFDAATVGATRIRNAFEFLAPGGFNALQAGQPTLYNLDRYLSLGGIASKLAFGSAKIENRDRYITPAGKYSTLFGTAFMQGGVTQVLVSGIAPPTVPQGSWTSFSPRFIEAGDMQAPGLPVPEVGGTRYLEPTGFEATAWGERIIPEARAIYPEGQALTLWGDARPWNYTSWVAPESIKWQAEEVRWGQSSVWNWQRYVTQFHETEHVDQFGIWTGVENRNRVIAHHSTAPGALPSPVVENGARALLPAGIEAPAEPEYYKAGMVAYRVREFPIDGIEAPALSYWLSVLNGARVVAPAGFATQAHGQPSLENNRRSFPYITGGDQQIIGTPMVADRIRSITFESRYGISPPQIDLPDVKLGVRYIEPPGYDASSQGGHHLHIHWTIITPRWTHLDLLGEPVAHNVTPEVPVYGHNSEEFGLGQVRTQWRRIEPDGLLSNVFGPTTVSDRRRQLHVGAIRPASVSDKLKVQRTGPHIPEQQHIIQRESHGYDELQRPVPGDHGMGEPIMNLQLAYPAGIAALRFGEPEVTANSIRVEPGYQNYKAFGEPAVTLKIRTVDVDEEGIGWGLETDRFGTPRMSPHTIWAVVEAPDQAISNHHQGNLHYVDYSPFTGQSIKGVGYPGVTLIDRGVETYGQQSSVCGEPSLTLGTSYLEPKGSKHLRMGWCRVAGNVNYIRQRHSIPGVDDPDAPDVEPALFGTPSTSHYWGGPQEIKPIGFSGFVPAPAINLFNRVITANGLDAMVMGSSGGSPRYMQQRLHVGPPDWPTMEGFCAEEYGTPWVSLRVRDVFVPGSDQFLCEYELRNFALRMRVGSRPTPGPAARTIGATGFDALGAGVGNISNWVQYIRPDGNMDNFRKGAPT